MKVVAVYFLPMEKESGVLSAPKVSANDNTASSTPQAHFNQLLYSWAEVFYRYSSQVAVREARDEDGRDGAVLFEVERSQKIYSLETILARVRALLRRQGVRARVACAADAPTALAMAAVGVGIDIDIGRIDRVDESRVDRVDVNRADVDRVDCVDLNRVGVNHLVVKEPSLTAKYTGSSTRSLRQVLQTPLSRKGALPLSTLHYYASPFRREPETEKIIARKIYLLEKLGIQNLAGFLALPAQAIVSHLGVETLSLYEAVRDSRHIPWPFWRPPEKFTERLTPQERENLDGVGHSTETLAFLLKSLVDRMTLRLRGRGRRLVRFQLTFELEKTSRSVPERTFEWTLTLPHLSAREILLMMREKIDFCLVREPLGDIGTRIEDLRLDVLETAPHTHAQKDIFNPQKEEQHEAWLSLVSRLTDKLGTERVFMAIPQENYCPERAWKKTLTEGNQESITGAKVSESVSATSAGLSARQREDVIAPLADRPLRLFKKPIPISRTWFERVRVCGAPEVLASEWWSAEGGFERVYFRVEDRHGENFWVFRAGDQFFIHGYF